MRPTVHLFRPGPLADLCLCGRPEASVTSAIVGSPTFLYRAASGGAPVITAEVLCVRCRVRALRIFAPIIPEVSTHA
jgi:hypothetical protein